MQTFQRLVLKQFPNDGVGDETTVQNQSLALTLPTGAYRRRVYIGFAWNTLDNGIATTQTCQASLVLRDANDTELARFGWSHLGSALTQPSIDRQSGVCVPCFACEFIPEDEFSEFPTTTPGSPEEMVAVALNNGAGNRVLFRMQPMTVLNDTSELRLEVSFTQGVLEAGLFQIAFGVRADAP